MRVKVLDTPTLVKVNNEAIKHNFNQCFVEAVYEKLDPLGIHVIQFSLPHGPEDDHVRTQLLLKFKDEEYAQIGLLDMTWKTFNSLKEVSSEKSP